MSYTSMGFGLSLCLIAVLSVRGQTNDSVPEFEMETIEQPMSNSSEDENRTFESSERSSSTIEGMNNSSSSWSNAVNFYPLGLFFGAISVNYEHLFADKHGLFIQGGIAAFGSAKGFNTAFHYRNHYHNKPAHFSLNSPFWGPFVYFEKGETEAKDPNNSITYEIEFTYMKAGLNWGRRWIFGNTFNLVFRIGYGFPLVADFVWVNDKPEEAEAIENLTKLIAGIDGEFSMGFAF